jgi:hypothetical protein
MMTFSLAGGGHRIAIVVQKTEVETSNCRLPLPLWSPPFLLVPDLHSLWELSKEHCCELGKNFGN